MPRYSSVKDGRAEDCGPNSTDPGLILMSSSPSCRNHIVVVPNGQSNKDPQRLDHYALLVGLAFATRASPRMWLFFDSSGSAAPWRRLAWEGIFPASNSTAVFPLEAHLLGEGGLERAARSRGPISLWRTRSWPLPGWVFTWDEPGVLEVDTGLAEWRLAEFVHNFVSRLRSEAVAHFVLIGAGGTRVAVLPHRRPGPRAARAPCATASPGHAALGWWSLARRAALKRADEASVAACLRAAAPSAAAQEGVLRALGGAGWALGDAAELTLTV